MLFVKKVVQVPEQPVIQETRIVEPTQRTVIVDRSTLSQGTILAIVLGGMALLAMAIYFWWYRPNYVEVQTPTVIERTHEVVTQSSTTTPPVVVHQPPVVIHDQAPATTAPSNRTVIVEGAGGAEAPPATSSGSSDTSNGSTSSDTNQGTSTTGGQ